jgi:hypothetical protein
MEPDAPIAARHKQLEGIPDERHRRLHAAVEAKVPGHGGVKRVSAATGVARGSILPGMKELDLPQGSPADSPLAFAVRVRGAGNWGIGIGVCERRWNAWQNRHPEAILCRHCAGRAGT